MAPDRVVEAVDIAGNSLLGLGVGVEDGAPYELGFDRLKERLDHGVVEAVSLARHGDTDAVAAQFGLVVHRAVLAAAVRMMNEPFGRTSHNDGPAQGCEREVAVQPVADRPADDTAGEQIDDHRQIEPPLARPDIGDVHTLFLVRGRRREILVDDVGRDRPSMLAVGGSLEPPLLPAAQAVLAHQPRRAPTPDGKTLILQLPRHARTAIGAVRQRECRADMRQHHHVVLLSLAGGAVLPDEVAALADAEYLA